MQPTATGASNGNHAAPDSDVIDAPPSGSFQPIASNGLLNGDKREQYAQKERGHAPAEVLADEPENPRGVHQITKKTNYWFEREIHVIERQAEAWASDWAQRGLPRHDVPRTEPLEPEQVLSSLCGQLFRDWQLRVRTKMQDAIAEAGEILGGHVATMRAGVARLQAIKLQIADRELRIERIRKQTEAEHRPVRYESLISGRAFWCGAIALGAVEFMANFPVFRLLLPMNAALAKVAGGVADSVDTQSLSAGLVMLATEWATHIEAVVVALVAVVILVVLGKFAGRSARAWSAVTPGDFPTQGATIRAHRREFGVKGALSALGIGCALAFLFSARGDIAGMTHLRVEQDRAAVQAAEGRLAADSSAADADIMAANTAVMQLRDALLLHEEDERYASTVQRNNVPILFLNFALVITAAVLGFAAAHADLGEKRGEHPDLIRLRERCTELRAEELAVDHEARAAGAKAHMAVARIAHLLDAHPLRGWESKVKRLGSVIPRFRGENARLRGLDPANIRAFDAPPVLDLPPVNEQLELVEPAEFKKLRDELQELRLSLIRLNSRENESTEGWNA